MDLRQLKQEAAALSEADRLALRAFLMHLGRVDDLAHQRDLGDRMRRMDAGEKTSVQEFVTQNLPWEDP